MTTASLKCKCMQYELTRGRQEIHRLHVNAFIGKEDRTETHTLGQCWIPPVRSLETCKCMCGAYTVPGAREWCVVQIEWGKWSVMSATGHRSYFFIQELHRFAGCIVFKNGEKQSTVDDPAYAAVRLL